MHQLTPPTSAPDQSALPPCSHRLLRPRDVAEHLAISVSQARRLMGTTLPVVRLSDRVARVRESDVVALVDHRRKETCPTVSTESTTKVRGTRGTSRRKASASRSAPSRSTRLPP